jgi:hypothetical protein
MRRQQWGLYAIALAILAVALAVLGVPASTLLIAAFVLVCPVMMFVVMSSTRDSTTRHDSGEEAGRDRLRRRLQQLAGYRGRAHDQTN